MNRSGAWQDTNTQTELVCQAQCARRADQASSAKLHRCPAVNLPCAQVLQGTGATREIGNKLLHEEQQKPSDLPDELRHGDDHGANPPGPMSSEDKHVSVCCWLACIPALTTSLVDPVLGPTSAVPGMLRPLKGVGERCADLRLCLTNCIRPLAMPVVLEQCILLTHCSAVLCLPCCDVPCRVIPTRLGAVSCSSSSWQPSPSRKQRSTTATTQVGTAALGLPPNNQCALAQL